VNILNKQSRTADMGWPSSLGVRRWLTTLPPPPTVENYIFATFLQPPRKWTDSLALRKYRKIYMRLGTWNVRRP
jgi:hypothetical protein